MRSLEVLLEDNHLLAVSKPAGLVTMGAKEGTATLLDVAKAYLKRKYDKPGKVYLGIVSRLDAPVTGVVLLARTSKAAARLNAAFRGREVDKTYLALVEGVVDPPEATLEHYLLKDERHRKVHVTRRNSEGAQYARLSYRAVRSFKSLTLLEVTLDTGRKHQIRVQLSHVGLPILGDTKYGSRRKFSAGIGLHARRLGLQHPVQKTKLEIEAPIPATWARFGVVNCENGPDARSG